LLKIHNLLVGAAVAAFLFLWFSFLSRSERPDPITQAGLTSQAPVRFEVSEPAVSLVTPSGTQAVVEEQESKTLSARPSDTISIGEYLEPDRGADFSQPLEEIAIGEYIDPNRGADYSEPTNPISIGEYIDPDRGVVFEVDPIDVLSIGAFIDPDSLSVIGSTGTVEVGEYVDPDQD